jgi:glycosyltransferase
MKYTFLMPAYKAAYIKEAIENILDQTYKDFQLIVSDDCSPEDLKTIVTQFNDKRVLYRCNEQNMGGKNLVAHWNLLLEIAKSDYVILAPDDDLYAPTFLEEINKLVIKYPDVNVLKSRVKKIDADGDLLMKDRVYEEFISQLDNMYFQALPDHMSGIGNYVFRTEALKKIGGFVDYPLAWWSDVMTNIRLSDKGMAITKDILFTMRMSGISITTRKSSLGESRKKSEATMMCIDDIEKMIGQMSSLSKYDTRRMDILRNYFAQWLTDDLLVSAPAYTFREMKYLMRKYDNLLFTTINRILFIRYWFIGRFLKNHKV